MSAFEQNRDPILAVLKEVMSAEDTRVFEVGSGTGEHAVYFAKNLKNVVWTTSDVLTKCGDIRSLLDASKLPNVRGPMPYEIGKDDFPRYSYDLVFTANTFHIMGWKQCKSLIKTLGARLREGSQVAIYGPFNYNGTYSCESNAIFDKIIKERDPQSGIRAFEDVNAAMLKNGFALFKDFEMPANNRMLVYTRLVFMKE